MLSRVFGAALRGAVRCSGLASAPKIPSNAVLVKKSLIEGFRPNFTANRSFGSICSTSGVNRSPQTSPITSHGALLKSATEVSPLGGYVPVRTVIKFTMSRGKRQTVKTVLKRFYRLDWGIWIRTKASRHKRRWKKSGANARRSRQHVFCNSTQSWLLDKMVSPYWRKPKYWVDDPYEPYHKRDEFFATRAKPLP